ncbi:MAG: GldG family protein [Lachnospiraceae bacterium]|nr:GldG family protein [Lachnospiraceae bacterium]
MSNKDNKKEITENEIEQEGKTPAVKNETSEKPSKTEIIKEGKKSGEKSDKKAQKKAKRSLKARAFKKGWFSVALVVFSIAAVIIINMIASVLVEKVPALSIDTTSDNSFTLTDDTLDFLNTLDQDITLYVLSSEDDYKSGGEYFIQSNTLFHAYDNASDRITLKYIDLAANPTFNEKYPDEDLVNYNVIVQGENDYRYLLENDIYEYDQSYLYYYGSYVVNGSNVEEAISSAILHLTLKEKPKVTFISEVTEEDYSAFKNLLEKNGFETDEVSPATGTISDDTSVVVLYAPSVDLDSKFTDSLSNFLTNGGNYGKQLLYMPSYKLVSMPNIDSLLEEWGLAVEMGYAVENDMNYMANGGNYVLFQAQYAAEKYTSGMKNKSLPFCMITGSARAIKVIDESAVTAILNLTEQSEIAYTSSTETADEASSEPNYVSSPNAVVGAIATKSTVSNDTDTESGSTESKASNIIVIGSSYAVSEASLSYSTYGNSSYMLSLLNNVTDRGDVGITIETKSLEGAELGITSAQILTLGTVFIVVVPIAILIAGIVIFVRRRNM